MSRTKCSTTLDILQVSVMPKASDLRKRYLALLKEREGKVRHDEALVIYRNEWVRILLADSEDADRDSTIEVEMSPPFSHCSSSTPEDEDKGTEHSVVCSRRTMQSMIDHLQYMIDLERSGFLIDFAGNGCLFVAFRGFAETPDIETFRLLLPPSAGSGLRQKEPSNRLMSLVI